MNFDEINERVRVVAVFDDNTRTPCRPISFTRPNGVVVKISEIGLIHPQSDGIRTRHIFDVTDGMADYRLELDTQTLVWRLTAIGDQF